MCTHSWLSFIVVAITWMPFTESISSVSASLNSFIDEIVTNNNKITTYTGWIEKHFKIFELLKYFSIKIDNLNLDTVSQKCKRFSTAFNEWKRNSNFVFCWEIQFYASFSSFQLSLADI